MEAKETQVTAASPQPFSGSEQKPRERAKMFAAKPKSVSIVNSTVRSDSRPLVVSSATPVEKPTPVFAEPQIIPESDGSKPSILEESKEEAIAVPTSIAVPTATTATATIAKPRTLRIVRPGQQQQQTSLLPPIETTLLYKLMTLIKTNEGENVYTAKDPPPFVAQDRLGFTRFVKAHYPSFALPRLVQLRINPNACNEMKLQTTKYQAFVREYMRQASPYRGVLVYHGLGSGKTCTSIAASEALYGNGHKKIIITRSP
jgi:hypothetical protein